MNIKWISIIILVILAFIGFVYWISISGDLLPESDWDQNPNKSESTPH